MLNTIKPIRLSHHAIQQILFRGATEQEVIGAIRYKDWERAEHGRWQCRESYPEWHEKHYQVKQVRPIFVDDGMEIVVVTVYVYYF